MMGTEDKPKTKGQQVQAAANLEADLLALDRQAEKGSYLSKRSYMSGWIDLYAPEALPAEWKTLPWTLKIEKDPDTLKPAVYKVLPAHALEAFRHNGLVPYRQKEWLAPEEVSSKAK